MSSIKLFGKRKIFVIEMWNSNHNSHCNNVINNSFIYFILLAWRWLPDVDKYSEFKSLNTYRFYWTQFISRAIWYWNFNFAECDMQLSPTSLKIILKYSTLRMEANYGLKYTRSNSLIFPSTDIFNDKSTNICYTVP